MEKDIRYILVLCAACGINRNYLRRQSWLRRALYDVYIHVTLVALWGFAFFSILTRNAGEGFLLSWIVSTFVVVSQMAAHTIIHLEAIFKAQQHADLLRLLDETEEQLRLLLKQDIAKGGAFYKALRWRMAAMLTASMAAFGVFAVTTSLMHDTGFFWNGLLSNLTMRVRLMQVSIYIKVLQQSLRHLNVKIQQVVEFRLKPHHRLLDINYASLHLQSSDLLAKLRDIYAQIFEGFRLLNNFTGWGLFAIITSYILDITTHSYWALLALDGLLSPLTFLTSLSTLLPITMVFFYLCYISHQCMEAAELTRSLVNKLLINFRGIGLYQRTAYEFLMQLKHQSIEISARRYFRFNANLLMNIFAAILSFLIMLIQFFKYDL